MKNINTSFKLILVVISMLLFLTKDLLAHQGTTINYRIFLKFDDLKITDVGESWSFDELTSKSLLKKYKLNDNTVLDQKESIAIGNRVMKGLENVRYFTYILENGKDLGKLKASGFKAKIKDGILSVAFNTPLPTAVDVSKKTLSIQVKDEDYVVETKLLSKKPVILLGISSKNCNIDIEEKRHVNGMFTKEELILMDYASPKEISISCNKIN